MNKIEKMGTHPKFWLFGFVGVLFISIGSLIAAIAYRGPNGQAYSIATHFISELGGIKESELAIAFNLGVIIGGLLLVVFLFGLLAHFPTKLGKFGCIVGIISGINGALVGAFPFDGEDMLELHGLTAFTFFYGGMATMIILSLALILDKDTKFPKYVTFVGVIGSIIFLIFNITIGEFASIFSGESMPTDFSIDDFRPQGFWAIAFFEWLSLLSVLAWMGVASIEIGKINKGKK